MGLGGRIWVQREPSVMRREMRLAQGLHVVGSDVGLELVVQMGCAGLGNPGALLTRVLCCPKCCFGWFLP